MKYDFEICRQTLKFIGQGTGRAVFDLDNGQIVKVPHVHGGIDQNMCEIEVFKKYGDRIPLTRIDLDKSDNGQIVAEKVQELPETFEKTYDLDTTLFLFSLIQTQSMREDFVNEWETKNLLIYRFLQKFLAVTPEECSNILFDVCAFNMGIRRTETGLELVILDYGYSEEYSHNRPANYFDLLNVLNP